MKNCTIKKMLSFSMFTIVLMSVFAFSPAPTKAEDINLWGDPFDQNAIDIGKEAVVNTGLAARDPRVIAANIIRVLLGLLGVIAVILILVGGFRWMTASGNEENVKKAQQLIGAGVIGLLVVLAAYAITTFVLRSFLDALGSEYSDTQYQLVD